MSMSPDNVMLFPWRLPSPYTSRGDTPSYEEVFRYAKLILDEMQDSAIEASMQLGKAPPYTAQAEADLRVFIHALVRFAHDKDFRTAAAFPSELLARFCLCFIRIDSKFQGRVVTIPGQKFKGEPKKCLWLLAWKGHLMV